MPEMPFNPNVRGGSGPSRNPALGDDILSLLQLLSQAGAGPAADALSQGNPGEAQLMNLIRQLTGEAPGPRDMGQALGGMQRREAGPAMEPQMPANVGESRLSALLQQLLGG